LRAAAIRRKGGDRAEAGKKVVRIKGFTLYSNRKERI
jgi:hypothetical protein